MTWEYTRIRGLGYLDQRKHHDSDIDKMKPSVLEISLSKMMKGDDSSSHRLSYLSLTVVAESSLLKHNGECFLCLTILYIVM